MEPIKQEIINNIFENGDKLITGPILQTVLIDMIDDVNVKDQEILSKTGSWDEAATQIPNLATKEEVTNLSESVARDLENVVGGDLTGYATEQWVQDQGYLKEHQDISNLATKAELTEAETNLQGNITSLSESVARDLASVPEGVATEAWVQSQDYASKSYVNDAVSSSSVDLTGYATETWVQNQGYLTEHQDISNLATKSELTSVSESVQTDITNLSESVANSVVWKKGTGTDSVVQVIADGTNPPVATGERAIATGLGTKASGEYSHAEGYGTNASKACSHAEGNGANASGEYSHAEGLVTNASGMASHAEGNVTKASGTFSHAEGYYTIAANQYEHAQGRYNYTSSNQIFSIGAGEYVNGTTNRRNAVSVLAVPNSDTQILTSSFFVQNIGGYDGTNPTPGTNDLATVINNLPSGGGSSETLWKKGTGTDSVVQILTGDREAKTPTATGTGSIATGEGTKASREYSHAEGEYANASGIYSHAEGGYTEASGRGSHAEGKQTIAEGSYSHVEGQYTKAGHYSHAEGDTSNASGFYSHAEGNHAKAKGDYSHAEGNHTEASNSFEHAQGRYNHNSENQIFSIGTGNSDTDRRNVVSVLEVSNNNSYTGSVFIQNIGGYDGTNPTPGTNDLATVINNLPSGGSSETLWKKGTGTDSIVQVVTEDRGKPRATTIGAVAIGYATTASGIYSYAEGWYANAEGAYSHAEGAYTSASNWYSHTEGAHTVALGDGSHAEGNNTTASGIYSHAEGGHTIASNTCEHAQGRYNHNSTNQIFSIGTGNSDTDRRNAVSVLEVDNSGSYTSSFFVQNVGGYDGTNPEPGTNDLATVINGMSTGGGSSETLWEKGTGEDSLVQKLTGVNETNTPTASGTGSIAIGNKTNASGDWSHAEGSNTEASDWYSHAEGLSTVASKVASHAEGLATRASGPYSHAEGGYTVAQKHYSHAEGEYTIASNECEHAQGIYNHSSTNQIFSVGAGEYVNGTTNRRNAVSILAVPNSETQILTSSLFVQNVGGYDGTNPEPGTNDLATVINGMSTGGGSSETLWKKGEGQDSIVQVLTDETYPPRATGTGSIATGYSTKASGEGGHAEGWYTKASGEYSHAESYFAEASGHYSHAEGYFANASGSYSHAEGYYANALGHASHAEGYSADASGGYSHAEGYDTKASGQASHAEGIKTTASGNFSHAEGCLTSTTNRYEHAQGIANHNSTNQIFSVGAGEIDNPYSPDSTSVKTRRNALSVLAVPNSETQVVTASVFVQNIGGYDGTNPTPGTNDLATVLNNTETWTFTLEDGSTVTKTIIMR